MITITTKSGKTLTFPDGTSELVIRAAIERIEGYDLSGLRGGGSKPAAPAAAPSTFDISGLRGDQRTAPPAPALPDPKAERDRRLAQLRDLELREGGRAIEDLGFEDRETHYFNPKTGERILKRTKFGHLPAPPERAPAPAVSALQDVYAMEGRLPPDIRSRGAQIDAVKEAARGLPDRVVENIAGYALPAQAIEAAGAGLKREVKALVQGKLPARPGEEFKAGARDAFARSPHRMPEPISRAIEENRAELTARAVDAGLSDRESAALDTAQLGAAAALDPGNYLAGAGALKAGRFLDNVPTPTAALSEAAQSRLARSGEMSGLGLGPVDRTVDTLRDLTGQPWRTHTGYDPALEVPRPDGPPVRPRSVERDPIPVTISGTDDPALRAKILQNWDYVSRRHPRIAATVRKIEVVDPAAGGPGASMGDGVLRATPEYATDPETLLHELTHRAQQERGRGKQIESFMPTEDDLNAQRAEYTGMEAAAIRRGEAYRGLEVFRPSRLVDPRDLNDEELWSRYAQSQDRTPTDTIDVVRRRAEIEAFDHEIVRRSKIAGPEFMELGERYGGLRSNVIPPSRREMGMGSGRRMPRDTPADPGPNAVIDPGAAPAVDSGSGNIYGRFNMFLRSKGLDNPDAYHDLPESAQMRLDQEFAATDLGPQSPQWQEFLDREGLDVRDYRALSAIEKASLEDDFGRFVAEQSDPDDLSPATPLSTAERSYLADRGHPEFAPTDTPPDHRAIDPDRSIWSVLDQYPGADERLIRDAHRRSIEAELKKGRWPEGLLADDYPDIVSRYGYRDAPDPRQPGGMLNPHGPIDLDELDIEAGGSTSSAQVFDDPVTAVLGPDVAAEYRALNDRLRRATRDRLAGRAGTLLPHEEDAIVDRLADIKESVTPEQWGFAVSGQGDIPGLPDGRIFAQEPQLTSTVSGMARLVPDGDGVRALPADLTPANDIGRLEPRLLPDERLPMIPRDLPPSPTTIPARSADELAAESMGWKRPAGPPGQTQPVDPISTPDFQTNLAAQLDPTVGYFGDPEAAGYIIERSDEIFKQIGPPRSWDTLEEMALRLGKTRDELMTEPSWSVMPPEARLRLLYVIKGHEKDIQSIGAKLAANEATDIDKANLLRLIDERGEMIRLGVKTGSSYGRALNSLKMQARLSLDGNQLIKQQVYRRYADQISSNKALLDRLAALDPHNFEEMQAFLRHVDKPRFRDYLQEYWVASILSGPATHERNLIGNALNAVMENAVVRPASALFDRAAQARTGNRGIYLRETPAAVIGLTRGFQQGLHRGFEVLKRGYDITDETGKFLPMRSAFGRSQNKIVRDVVGPVVTMPLRLLAASDVVFKSMNFTAELYAQAARSAASKGLTGKAFADKVATLVTNPTDDMIKAANDFSLKATFNDPASGIGQKVIALREEFPLLGGFIAPFIKIADRLMVRGFEYTPYGAIKAVKAARSGANTMSADLAARASIGSLIMGYGASLAMEGRLTGSAPSSTRERAAFFNEGKQPWSVKLPIPTESIREAVGADHIWVPFGAFQPLATPLALVAASWKGWVEKGEEPDLARIGAAAHEVGKYITDQSYMDGISKFMAAVSGSDDQYESPWSDLVTSTVSGMTPYSGLTKSIARAVDPRLIDTRGEEGVPFSRERKSLAANFPGISLGMNGRLDPWGEEVVPAGGKLRSVLASGSILLPSREKSNPLDAELARLGMPLGYVDRKISDKIGRGKSRGTLSLGPDEWYYYQQVAGRKSKKLLERLFALPSYGSWDVERQREAAGKAIGMAREYARIQTVRRHRGLPAH